MAKISNYADPTLFRISTITCTACVGTEIDLDILYDNLNITEDETGITYLEFGKRKAETVYKGFSKKFLINRRRERPTRRFDNQLTIVHKLDQVTSINMKVFKNGNIQMTGIKNYDQGYDMIEKLIILITEIHSKHNEIVINIADLVNQKYKICLINSDYKIGFEIKRENLFKLLVNEYHNICSYEPCIYPGVKIQYFWNSESDEKDGVCNCTSKCFFKKKSGTGYGENNCKKITIAVFQSGSIIITGSQKNEQIEECYSFINNLLYKNINKIERKQIICLTSSS